MTRGARIRRRALVASVVLVALLAPLAHAGTRLRVLAALFDVDAPFGPKAGPLQDKDCSFRDDEKSDLEIARISDERCEQAVVTACGASDRAEIDHYTSVIPSCVEKLPGCRDHYAMLRGRRVSFRCLSGTRSRWDPYRDDPVLVLDEAGP